MLGVIFSFVAATSVNKETMKLDGPRSGRNGPANRCDQSGIEQRSSQRRAVRASETRGIQDRTV